ncbi:hypothetical protein OS493_013422 [Desmophyllum pertusum]|uniref:Uncharacterized protein n=1 Tax=Desmophyllum pertusum TaxID=174260 RepID=A0A9X0CHF2_9CNID|nr:hypothetical protein OS493_013422 [Desmophyllum pertusum]
MSSCTDKVDYCARWVGKGYCNHHKYVNSMKEKCMNSCNFCGGGGGRSYINECDRGNNRCSHGCVNTQGSYICTCPNGFQLSHNQHTCHDINECDRGKRRCSHGCVNTQGSYICTCPNGFQLSHNQHTCHACRDKNDQCAYWAGIGYCKKTHVNYMKKNCMKSCNFCGRLDINECDRGKRRCSHGCVNTQGSYICTCPNGFQLSHNQHTCHACRDKNDQCAYWAGIGYCKKTHVNYMKKNCMKSCNFCGRLACRDKNDQCAYWAGIGYCKKTHVNYMKKNCMKSCNFCGRLGRESRRSF